ncbi:coiled-coil domain-containing protein 137 [Orussus abietinus]|uniref:coiled-coil domain-containing protein 137 n=1 Tax=Orussus abietinus TaxID=222816 RepID=UPI0006252D3A|nr:coiled-coil domain-containing protein 137 [Orussus abietinus]
MGKRIPKKKHRGVRDVEKQRAKRFADIATKTNDPPKDVDGQDIPESLKRVIKLKDDTKAGKIKREIKKKKKKGGNRLIAIDGSSSHKPHPKGRPDKVVPKFIQKVGESNESFMHRVSRETHAFVNETAFEKKYNVEVERDPGSGTVVGVKKCPKDELEELAKLKMKHKNIGKKKKKKGNSEDSVKLTKAQKKKKKEEEKKIKKLQQKEDDKERVTEKVKFGEVVHAPPNLTVRPKKAKDKTTNKPGKKDLLLNALVQTKAVSPKHRQVDKKGKLKNLSAGERRQLEKERSDAIAAYKRLKAQKLSVI